MASGNWDCTSCANFEEDQGCTVEVSLYVTIYRKENIKLMRYVTLPYDVALQLDGYSDCDKYTKTE